MDSLNPSLAHPLDEGMLLRSCRGDTLHPATLEGHVVLAVGLNAPRTQQSARQLPTRVPVRV